MDELDFEEVYEHVRLSQSRRLDSDELTALTHRALKSYKVLDLSPRRWEVRELVSQLSLARSASSVDVKLMRHYAHAADRTGLDLTRLNWSEFVVALSKVIARLQGQTLHRLGWQRHLASRYVVIIDRRLNDGAIL